MSETERKNISKINVNDDGTANIRVIFIQTEKEQKRQKKSEHKITRESKFI